MLTAKNCQRIFNAFQKAFKKLGQVNLDVGLQCVLDVSLDRPKFEGQTKDRLASKEIVEPILQAIQPAIFRAIKAYKEKFEEVVTAAKRVDAALDEGKRKAKLASIVRETTRGVSNLPLKLNDAVPGTRPADRELYLLEGDSATSTANECKLPHQSTLPLRGKLPNLIRDGRKALSNKEVLDIITCCGYNPKRPTDNLRIGKLMLLADADVDGGHVCVLMLTAIYKTMPELFTNGMVYVVLAPLYQASVKGKKIYANSIDLLKKQGATKFKRVKGWGGCNKEELKELAFATDSRRLLKILPPSNDEVRPFEEIMGEVPAARKKLMGLK